MSDSLPPNTPDQQLLKRIESAPQEVCKEYEQLEDEVRKLSLQVRELEKGKSHFLSNVRNEINNPLASILGLAEAISRISREDKIKSLGSLVHQQAFVLDFQIRNIILSAEIESGDINPYFSNVNIASLLESQLDYLSARLNSSKVSVRIEAHEHLHFLTDSYLFQSIFLNLAANAIEFSGNQKMVLVKAWLEENSLLITVTDYGQGISSEQQEQLYKRFKQLDSGSTKVHPGHGLGLAIVYELVNILNGTIEMKTADNQGTSITIRLPKPEGEISTIVSEFGNEILFNEGEEF